MRTGRALIGAVAHAGFSTLLSACIILCESNFVLVVFFCCFVHFLLILVSSPHFWMCTSCPEQGQRETCVGKPGTIPGSLQHEVLRFKARHYIGIYTIYARMDAAATIIFRSGKMWRLVFKGGYHSRMRLVHYWQYCIVRIIWV